MGRAAPFKSGPPDPLPVILAQLVRGSGVGVGRSLLSKRAEGLSATGPPAPSAFPEAADSPASLGSCRTAFLLSVTSVKKNSSPDG